jgi:hypothetical protein
MTTTTGRAVTHSVGARRLPALRRSGGLHRRHLRAHLVQVDPLLAHLLPHLYRRGRTVIRYHYLLPLYVIGILHTNENEGGIMTEGPRLPHLAELRDADVELGERGHQRHQLATLDKAEVRRHGRADLERERC